MTGREPLEVLLELTRLLAAERTLDDALRATTNAALAVLPCDHASLRLFDGERRELLSTARSGAGSSIPPAQFRSGEGVLGLVADTGRGALIEDTATDPRFTDRPIGFSVRSLVAVPLVAGGRVVGVLSASDPAPHAFTERDRDLAQLLANCTVPAIETARLAHLAITDDLTHAYNYRVLAPRLNEEVNRAARYGEALSILMMDLDHFKRVNDAHGHAVGDEVLRGFADRVRTEVRQSDVLIRRGGEEFLLIMPSTGGDEASRVAERIRARVAEAPIDTAPIDTEHGVQVALTVSIGVATWRPGEDALTFATHADTALYQAKDAGRNSVAVWSPEPR